MSNHSIRDDKSVPFKDFDLSDVDTFSSQFSGMSDEQAEVQLEKMLSHMESKGLMTSSQKSNFYKEIAPKPPFMSKLFGSLSKKFEGVFNMLKKAPLLVSLAIMGKSLFSGNLAVYGGISGLMITARAFSEAPDIKSKAKAILLGVLSTGAATTGGYLMTSFGIPGVLLLGVAAKTVGMDPADTMKLATMPFVIGFKVCSAVSEYAAGNAEQSLEKLVNTAISGELSYMEESKIGNTMVATIAAGTTSLSNATNQAIAMIKETAKSIGEAKDEAITAVVSKLDKFATVSGLKSLPGKTVEVYQKIIGLPSTCKDYLIKRFGGAPEGAPIGQVIQQFLSDKKEEAMKALGNVQKNIDNQWGAAKASLSKKKSEILHALEDNNAKLHEAADQLWQHLGNKSAELKLHASQWKDSTVVALKEGIARAHEGLSETLKEISHAALSAPGKFRKAILDTMVPELSKMDDLTKQIEVLKDSVESMQKVLSYTESMIGHTTSSASQTDPAILELINFQDE